MTEKNKNRNGYIATVLCILIELVSAYVAFQLSPVSGPVMERIGVDSVQFSSCFTAPQIPGIVLCIIAGMLMDRFGIKKVMGIGLVVASIGGIIRIFAVDYGTFMISLILTGIPLALANVTAGKVAAAFFTGKKAALVVGLTVGASSLGGVITISTTALFTDVVLAFIVASAALILTTVLWLVLVKEIPKSETLAPAEFKKSLPIVLKNRGVWLSCIIAGLAVTVDMFIVGSMPTAFQSMGMTASTAGIVVSIFSVGNALGNIFAPVVTVKMNKKIVLVTLAVIVGVCTVFVWKMPVIPAAIIMLMTGIGIGGQFTTVFSLAPASKTMSPYAGTVSGMIGSMQTALGTIITSYVVIPLVGDSYEILFLVAGLCMIPAIISAVIFPKNY